MSVVSPHYTSRIVSHSFRLAFLSIYLFNEQDDGNFVDDKYAVHTKELSAEHIEITISPLLISQNVLF